MIRPSLEAKCAGHSSNRGKIVGIIGATFVLLEIKVTVTRPAACEVLSDLSSNLPTAKSRSGAQTNTMRLVQVRDSPSRHLMPSQLGTISGT
ncbi:unnamed protein product [Ceratitis capitata]|uniref:(Mediterranean fruit fly) hypothetical protein n=1 Tax=Ceratitis capitata TaxID=7213 RepID=A0A811UUN5_CERCA|nr:unnamed protein product [Ceratitis capitata]CAD7002020.1 unnamed protein product [Ceratitis capitata]